MRLKQLFFLATLAFVVVASVSFVSAADCRVGLGSSIGSGEVAILHLSGPSNAHAEKVSGSPVSGQYYVICQTADIGSIESTCTDPTHTIVKLTSNNGPHAEPASGKVYSTRVCASNIASCSAKFSCVANEVGVLSLSGLDNAHVSPLNSYQNKICCALKTEACVSDPECNAGNVGQEVPSTSLCIPDTPSLRRIFYECEEVQPGCYQKVSGEEKCNDIDPAYVCKGSFAGGNSVCDYPDPYCGDGIKNTASEDCDLGDGTVWDRSGNDGTRNGDGVNWCTDSCTIKDGWIPVGPNWMTTYFSKTSDGAQRTNNAQVGDMVYMIFRGSAVSSGQEYEIEISEYDSGINPDDNVRRGGSAIEYTVTTAGFAAVPWTIDNSDWNDGFGLFSESEHSPNTYLEFYYEEINTFDVDSRDSDFLVSAENYNGLLKTTQSGDECAGDIGEECLESECPINGEIEGSYSNVGSGSVCCTVGLCGTGPELCGNGDWDQLDGEECEWSWDSNCIRNGDPNECTCESGYESDGAGGCRVETVAPTSCESYKSPEYSNPQASCNSDTDFYDPLAQYDFGDGCYGTVEEGCVWTTTDGCKLLELSGTFVEDPAASCTPGQQNDPCVYDTSTTGDCSTDTDVTLSFSINGPATIAQGGNPDTCRTKSPQTIVCPQQVKLSFFGVWQFIISGLVVAFLYFLLHLDNKKKK